MAETNAPRPPSITPVPATGPQRTAAPAAPKASEPPKISLPADTITRWQDIVRQALLSGRDISVLVQQYAEQSFNTKLAPLDTQGARRRMLARAHAALERERARAVGHLEAQPSVKPPVMSRSYLPNLIEVPGPQDAPPAAPPGRSDKKADIEWHHTTTPAQDAYTKRSELEHHIEVLHTQMKAIDEQLPVIDAVLNKGLRNQQNVVTELAAVSRELYRLAQEVQVDMPVKPTPVDGSGYQKSPKKKESGPSHATTPGQTGPSAPEPDPGSARDEPAGQALKTTKKTVPINPLVPAGKAVAKVLAAASTQVSRGVHQAVSPVAHAAAQGASAIGRAIATGVQAVTGTIGRVFSATLQAIQDAWPWRGPPPE